MFMSPDLFLNCILCIINDNSERLRKLIDQLIQVFETDNKTNTTIDNDVTRFYIRILKDIMQAKVTKDHQDELRIILLKFQSDPILSKRKEIYELLHGIFTSAEKLSTERLNELSATIQNMLLWHDTNKLTRSQFAILSRAADMINPLDQANELRKVRKLSEGIHDVFEKSHAEIGSSRPEPVERVDLSDRDSMRIALNMQKERSVTGVLRMGLQGLNRMFGERGGLARGESLVVYALKHNYKSSLMMSIATWVALYNNASVSGVQGDKKQLVLLISLENEAHQNFVWMYRHHYEAINRSSSKHLNDDQVTEWCHETFNKSGFTLVIERFLPQKFTYNAFVSLCEYYINSGYHIVFVGVDYLNLMNKTIEGMRTEANHLAVRDIFSSFCNYTKSKGITFVTAHPLNRKAAELRATGVANVVKRFDESHLADSVDVAREVDLEVFINIERNLDNIAYLTFQRGKHRYVDNTPDQHKYFAQKFHKDYGIIDDVLLAPTYVSDIYADKFDPEAERGEPSQAKEQDFADDNVF